MRLFFFGGPFVEECSTKIGGWEQRKKMPGLIETTYGYSFPYHWIMKPAIVLCLVLLLACELTPTFSFQSESRCKNLLLVISVVLLPIIWMKTDIPNEDFTCRLALKYGLKGICRWPCLPWPFIFFKGFFFLGLYFITMLEIWGLESIGHFRFQWFSGWCHGTLLWWCLFLTCWHAIFPLF